LTKQDGEAWYQLGCKFWNVSWVNGGQQLELSPKANAHQERKAVENSREDSSNHDPAVRDSVISDMIKAPTP